MATFELDDRQADAYMLWTDLWSSLKEQCEASSSALSPRCKLRFRRDARTEAMVIYSNARRHDGKLHITYHPYFCAVRYAVDVDPFFGELFVKVHGDESYFETAEHIPMTASRAHMIPSICPYYFLTSPKPTSAASSSRSPSRFSKRLAAMSSPARARPSNSRASRRR